jgi:NhaP-type Na+/H+ or K+/H+ antiporter
VPAPECVRPMSTANFHGLLIIIGPSVLAWVKVDQPVAVMALLGLAFLLFLAGLEVDLRAMTP